MTPERWRQITEIFHAARTSEPTAREALLRDACAADPSLRDDVERMLAAHDAGRTLDVFASTEPAASWQPGAQFGPYRIEALVGAGGMGEVYRAVDTRLRRTVAIKVLAPELASNPEWLGRFEREAQMLAALNHPQIAAIHGIEEIDGRRALVLEFVEGKTLDEAIDGRPRPLTETLTVARQIAEALEAAHDRGIIHRDLKPSNIKITPGGTVKVLDFGIATSAAADGDHEVFTRTATREGLVLGTAAYMSPEQARGQTVDKRADIWAFGCVLYEMLTGRRPFDGDTRSDTIARVLEREPDWTAVPAVTPESIVRLVRRCLSKDAAHRLHDIADARLEIAEALERPSTSATAIRPGRRSIWMTATGAIVIAAAAVWWAMASRSDGRTAAPAVEFGVHFPENHIPAFGVAVAPDGRQIVAGVFGSSSQLYLHSLGSSETRALAGTEGAFFPFWSPDGTRVGYVAHGELRTLALATGVSNAVCPVPAGTAGATWNREGLILFAFDRALFTVPATGGEPRRLSLNDQTSGVSFPRFLPDQRHFIFFSPGTTGGTVRLASLDSSDVIDLVSSDAVAAFVAPDHLLFVRGTALMSQRFDPVRRTLEGEPQVVARGVVAGTVGSRPLISASADTLAFGTALGGSVGQLTWIDRSGKAVATLAQAPGPEYLNPSLSPDGRLVAVNRMDPATGSWDIWMVDPGRGVSSRLTTDAAIDSDPVWSPDGREIVFASNRNGALGLYRKAVSGSQPESRILTVTNTRDVVPSDWSLDGKYILYSQAGMTGPGPWSIWALPLFGDQKPILVVDERFAPYAAHVSPDGKWMAYNSFETGRQEIFVQRFLAPGQKQLVSDGGGVHPRWTRNGREIVYWAVPGGINAVDFSSSGSTFTIGARRTLLEAPVLSAIDGRTHYDITRDGERLLVRRPAGPQGPGVTVVLNWQDRLKGR